MISYLFNIYQYESFYRFIYTKTLSDVLSPAHYKSAHEKSIFLNKFQPAHDLRLRTIARKMRNEGLISKTFAKMNGLTVVVPNGSTQKVRIYDEDDLVQFAGGRNLSDFYTDQSNFEDM